METGSEARDNGVSAAQGDALRVARDGVTRCRRMGVGRPMLAALAAAAMLVTTGCLGGSDDGDSSSGAPVPKTLKIGYAQTTLSLDPAKAQNLWVLGQIGGTLTEYGTDGEPALAESTTESADRLSWTAKLRSDAKFSDGQPVTAHDVKATFQRIQKDEAAPFRFALDAVTSIATPDDRTVVFNLSRPSPSFPKMISMSAFIVLPRAGIEQGASFFKKPISSGPYKITSVSQNRVQLAANKLFWGPKKRVRNVDFVTVADAGTRLAQLKSGQIHGAMDMPVNLVPQMTGTVHPLFTPEPGSLELIPNNQAAVVSDAGVRKAISAAVDREKINELVFQGKAQENAGYWPKAFASFYDSSLSTEPDPAKAKELLNGTACESGCSIKLMYYTDNPWAQQVALIVQQNLKAVGIDLKLDGKAAATGIEQSRKMQYQLLLGTLTGLVVDPAALAPFNLDPEGIPWMGYKSPGMAKLIDALVEAPEDQQAEIADQITQLFQEDQPFINLTDFLFLNASNVPQDVFNTRLWGVQVG